MNNETKIVSSVNVERDNYADFLKYLLICMVVLGHFIGLYQYRTGIAGGLYTWIYSFHMPLFVFISGYFSKHINDCRRKTIDTLLYPFILFQAINIIYTFFIPYEPLIGNIFYPYHQNWYLLALFWWRCFIPYRRFFKKWIVIAFSILLSLSVGFFPEWNGFLGLYKTAYFLPFFVFGIYCDDLTKLLTRLISHKLIWLCIFIVSILVIFLLSSYETTLLNLNYAFKANLGYDGDFLKLLLRSCALCGSILICISVLLVTKLLYNILINKWVGVTGGGTMLAFVGHEFIMIPLIYLYIKIGTLGFVLCVISSFLVTFILTRKPIVDFFSPLMDLSVLCKRLRIKIYKE